MHSAYTKGESKCSHLRSWFLLKMVFVITWNDDKQTNLLVMFVIIQKYEFVYNNFCLSYHTTLILPSSCSSFATCRMNYILTLKGLVEKFDLRSSSWPDRKRSCCISVDPYRWPEHIYDMFRSTNLAGLWYEVWILRVSSVVSETGGRGGYKSLPSQSRYGEMSQSGAG